jgi:hypothetical protein
MRGEELQSVPRVQSEMNTLRRQINGMLTRNRAANLITLANIKLSKILSSNEQCLKLVMHVKVIRMKIKILYFCNNQNLKFLAPSSIHFSDSTFKTLPGNILQLFTTRGIVVRRVL